MYREAVSDVCAALAHEISAARAKNVVDPSQSITARTEQLFSAPATSLVDALALSAVARRLIVAAFSDVFNRDQATMNDTELAVLSSVILLGRATAILEAETGFSAEGFTGEIDVARN